VAALGTLNARSAATIAAKLSEPSDCPAGRRFAAALWLGVMVILSISLPLPMNECSERQRNSDNPTPLRSGKPLHNHIGECHCSQESNIDQHASQAKFAPQDGTCYNKNHACHYECWIVHNGGLSPNDQAQRPPPETPGRLQPSLPNYLNRPTAQRGGGSLQRSG